MRSASSHLKYLGKNISFTDDLKIDIMLLRRNTPQKLSNSKSLNRVVSSHTNGRRKPKACFGCRERLGSEAARGE